MRNDDTLLAGIDFTCSPSRRKPITIATGRLAGERLVVEQVVALDTLAAFERWLETPGPWLAAFDFPFGLPRVFVEAHALGDTCADVITAVRARWATRMAWRAAIDAWNAGDRKKALSLVPDSMMESVFVFGTPERICNRLRNYQHAGITATALQFTSYLAKPEEKRARIMGAMEALSADWRAAGD